MNLSISLHFNVLSADSNKRYFGNKGFLSNRGFLSNKGFLTVPLVSLDECVCTV